MQLWGKGGRREGDCLQIAQDPDVALRKWLQLGHGTSGKSSWRKMYQVVMHADINKQQEPRARSEVLGREFTCKPAILAQWYIHAFQLQVNLKIECMQWTTCTRDYKPHSAVVQHSVAVFHVRMMISEGRYLQVVAFMFLRLHQFSLPHYTIENSSTNWLWLALNANKEMMLYDNVLVF